MAQAFTKLSNPDYAKLAEAFGGEGFRVTSPDELENAIQLAFASPKPCIVGVHVKPDELIMPTKITAEMVMGFGVGMLKTKLSKSNQ